MRNVRLIMWLGIAACGGSGGPGVTGDGGGGDGGGMSAGLAPRLIAPLSMAAVTQQQPTLRWVPGTAAGTPVVDLCKDRACTAPLPIAAQITGDGRSAVPAAALPPGWVFWRVRVVDALGIVSSATWQFWVGAASASSPVDTSRGIILDVNGDGYADFLVGAESLVSGNGAAHLYLGSAAASADGWNGGAPAQRIDLVSPDGAAAGFGISVASVGDINGDGYADFVVGSYLVRAAGGVAHVYLGSPAPSAAGWNGSSAAARIDLVDPEPPDSALTAFGWSVASAGDVNGDGYADFVIGNPGTLSGVAYLYLGSATPDAAVWNGASAAARIGLTGDGVLGAYGASVAGVGDVNGDGYGDFLVGSAPVLGATPAYLYLGAAMPDPAAWNGASPARRIELDSPDGIVTGGQAVQFGARVASAGDVNNDGYTDFLISAFNAAGGQGAAHLYLGSAAPDGAGWNGTAAARRIDLVGPDGVGAGFGTGLASAGDLDGDGYGDFVVGSALGAAHVYVGSAAPDGAGWNGGAPARRVDLTAPGDALVGVGFSAASAGDVDGDGYDDVLVGATVSTGVAQGACLYRGTPAPGATPWNGTAPSHRIELFSTDGTDLRWLL